MNKNINNTFHCHACQKSFSTSKVYLWGKDKHFFCQTCNENNKKLCSWCEKDLNCQLGNFDKERCYSHNHHHERQRWDNDGSREYEYEDFCDQNCESQFNQYQENKPERIAERQKQEELLKQGYKPCQGRGIVPFLAGLEKCGTLIPPTENYCERCHKEQVKEKERERERDQKNPEKAATENEKYQKAQNWWNSLSKEQKHSELKKVEVEWIEKNGGKSDFNSFVEGHGSVVEFKDGQLYCSPDDLRVVPVVFLERFEIEIYPRFSFDNSFCKNFPGYNESLETKITKLEQELSYARQRNDRDLVKKLEQEIKHIKNRSKSDSSSSQSPKNHLITYVIGGGILVALILFVFLIVRKRKLKNHKIK